MQLLFLSRKLKKTYKWIGQQGTSAAGAVRFCSSRAQQLRVFNSEGEFELALFLVVVVVVVELVDSEADLL